MEMADLDAVRDATVTTTGQAPRPVAGTQLGWPLVSCIMPTRTRRRFVGQAIAYFLRQDYPAKELVIIDDGEDSVADLVPDDDRVRYRAVPAGQSIGAKRNIACEVSRGELIAHWDDDDWQSPGRLRRQVAALTAAGVDACGPAALLHYAPFRGEAWVYGSQPDDPPWVAGCSLLYRKEAWRANPFRDLPCGEDSAFLAGFAPEAIEMMPDLDLCLAVVHGGNTGVKAFADPHWKHRPLDEISLLLGADRAFYAGLRRSGDWVNISSDKLPTSVTVVAPFAIYESYGALAEYLVLGMVREGAAVNPVPIAFDAGGYSDELVALVRSSQPERAAAVLYNCWPRPELERYLDSPDLFINTMWESSRLPDGWADRLNRARAILVPTRFVADVCRTSGVSVPIEVVPEGLDPEVYRPLRRPERPGLTTLIVGTPSGRKHVREGVAAWQTAFEGDPEARLIIKTRFGRGGATPADPRIRLVDGEERSRGIAHWYAEADVLLALGNEGFGLPMIEGMATALPVIALASEGQGDLCREVPDLLLPVEPGHFEIADEPPYGRPGIRGVPSVAAVAERLRWVATHRGEAAALGRAASDWVRANRVVWSKAPAVLDVMEANLGQRRSLRRQRTMWVPGDGTPCGVAEYASYLTAPIPGAIRVVADRPRPDAVRSLHVQHADGLVANAELALAIDETRRAGAAVAVTEHSVFPVAYDWEGDADVLIGLTTEGVARLRRRWPSKDVRLLPHGCPTWFPPRKRHRGRVIGAFGFLGRHKGFWQLLDAIREMPETSLILYSHSNSPDLEASWETAARGLPVRRVGSFLPIEDVARRLAAEADILVYWYDEVPHSSASGAARVGLATGVPVLTSATGWFDGLEDVVHQPDDLVGGIQTLLDDTTLRERLVDAAWDHCQDHSWERTAQRHLALWESLEAA